MLLKLEPTARYTNFLVTGPDPKTKPRLIPSPSSEFLEVVEPPDLGHLVGQGDRGRQSRRRCWASASTLPDGESQFAPLEKPDLDTIFGKDGYSWPKTSRRSRRRRRLGRYGYEIFPWLMFLILIVVTLENFLANTFYKEAPEGRQTRTDEGRLSASIRSLIRHPSSVPISSDAS